MRVQIRRGELEIDIEATGEDILDPDYFTMAGPKEEDVESTPEPPSELALLIINVIRPILLDIGLSNPKPESEEK